MTRIPPPMGRRGVPAVYADGTALAQFLPGAPLHRPWIAWVQGRRVVTSQVGVTELQGAAAVGSLAVRAAADEVVESVEVLRFSDKALDVASHVSTALPPFVALHLGVAATNSDVAHVATYFGDLAKVAALYQLDVVTPGWPDRWWENLP
ncbi:MAG: hypothetical protein FWF28_00360 [Micrococcales bacterium]|nr:hypothetical protein [Micrococcales bacterium]